MISSVYLERLQLLRDCAWSLGCVSTVTWLSGEEYLFQCSLPPFLETDGERRTLVRIDSILRAEDGEATCISVDNPEHLFVTKDYVVTHNTVTSLVTASEIGKRVAVIVLSRFSDKWIGDLQVTYDVDLKDICKIQGGDALLNASHWASSGVPLPKMYVISIETLMVWVKKYIENPKAPELDAYGCTLPEFFSMLRIGTAIFDEVHMSLHQVFHVYCFLNVEWVINLSATVLSKDQTVLRIQRMMFPRYSRFEDIVMKQYIKCYGCSYSIKNFFRSKVRTTEFGSNRYSHVAFEKSVFQHRVLSGQYIKMVLDLIKESYHERYMEGDKLIVFVAMQDTARTLVDAIKRTFPQYDTRTYLQEDPFENAIEPDIRVTTIMSAGTALDIPNLRVAIMTVSVDSPTTNIQTLGRLRELKDRDVHFYYLFCNDIEKQVEYHRNKLELFRPRVLNIRSVLLDHLDPERR